MAPLPFGVLVTRAILPVLGVLGGVALLILAAGSMFVGAWDPAMRQRIFAAGVLCWMAGIGWGTWINGRPSSPPARQGDREPG